MNDDPRLSLADVLELVAGLPIGVIEGLAEGPMPEGRCRACAALKPHIGISAEAAALFGWHEFFEETPTLDAVLKGWPDHPNEEERHRVRAAYGEWKRVAGALSYSRCTTIYLAAGLEMVRRP